MKDEYNALRNCEVSQWQVFHFLVQAITARKLPPCRCSTGGNFLRCWYGSQADRGHPRMKSSQQHRGGDLRVKCLRFQSQEKIPGKQSARNPRGPKLREILEEGLHGACADHDARRAHHRTKTPRGEARDRSAARRTQCQAGKAYYSLR